jgi:hypothetical protein
MTKTPCGWLIGVALTATALSALSAQTVSFENFKPRVWQGFL